METRRATVALCLAAALAPAAAVPAGAQDKTPDPQVKGIYRGVIRAVKFDISPPLRSIPADPPASAGRRGRERAHERAGSDRSASSTPTARCRRR